MKLWWPPSVPYINFDWSSIDKRIADVGNNLSATEFGTNAKEDTSSPIYPTRLGPKDIRLIHLEATSGHQDPVRLDLSPHSDDDCPEYEAVSYTWGGENGDSTRSWPVYVGPYWDVSLQTRNCWDMLQFVRPRSGIRLIWVDALCINQNDVAERSVQVAKMAQIYDRCSQAILYLGPDVALNLPDDQDLSQRSLRDLLVNQLMAGRLHGDIEQPLNEILQQPKFPNVLRRKYFSRLWVIQELLLSPRIVLRIGSVDFMLDANTWVIPETETFEPDGHRVLMVYPAEWFSYACKGAMPNNHIVSVLHKTKNAHCADPRDKIFGILNLLQPEESDSVQPLSADYTISCQHLYIGFFAHLMVHHHLLNILSWASGQRGHSPSLPSWVPDWASATTSGIWTRVWFKNNDLGDPVGIAHNLEYSESLSVAYLWTDATKILDRHYFHGRPSLIYGIQHVLQNQEISHGLPLFPIPRPEIDITTGALSVNMVRLLAIPQKPIFMEEDRGKLWFRVEFPSGQMFLVSDHRLDELVEGGTDYLYELRGFGFGDGLGFLVLRKQTPDSRTHSLVTSGSSILFSLPTSNLPSSSPKISTDNPCRIIRGPYGMSLENAFDAMALWLKDPPTSFERKLFPGLQSHSMQLLAVYLTLPNKTDCWWQTPGAAEFADAYLQCLSADLLPAYTDSSKEEISITFTDETLKTYIESAFDLPQDCTYDPSIIADTSPFRPTVNSPLPNGGCKVVAAISQIGDLLFPEKGAFIMQTMRKAPEQREQLLSEMPSRTQEELEGLVLCWFDQYGEALLEIYNCRLVTERVIII